jgi:hypothetical protein
MKLVDIKKIDRSKLPNEDFKSLYDEIKVGTGGFDPEFIELYDDAIKEFLTAVKKYVPEALTEKVVRVRQPRKKVEKPIDFEDDDVIATVMEDYNLTKEKAVKLIALRKEAYELKKENIETIVIDKSVPKTDIDKSDERTDEKKKLPEKKAKEVINDNLMFISAVLSAETGKTRLEAVGETIEVVDMIEHYCAQIESNNGYSSPMKSTATESNTDLLIPYGTFAIIVPFNFPVALAAGMMLGALVTGNTVVVKSSDKTPRSTHLLSKIFVISNY